MKQSIALFLLVGKELVEAQSQLKDDWKYTQNWIAYEIGLAFALNIDVWVICDSIGINFPVPYLNNYEVHGFNMENEEQREFIYTILNEYKRNKRYFLDRNSEFYMKCPHKTCGSEFNFYSILGKGSKVPCPTCLRPIYFEDGWLLKE